MGRGLAGARDALFSGLKGVTDHGGGEGAHQCV
jgi:hypothetical protein